MPQNRRSFLAAAAALAATPGAGLSAPRAPRQKPNFIVVMCDDLGYGDIGAFGGPIPTPHLDRLAASGTAMTDFYAAANLCTPSRAGLLTGRYPIRTGLARGVIMQNDPRGLPLAEVTMAEALKPDYATALIGKWHLGHSGPSWPPTRHGFDLFFGLPYSHDMLPLSLYEASADAAPAREDLDYPQLQQRFCQRAERFITENAARPFLLNLWLSAPHLPNFPDARHDGRTEFGLYGDTVAEIDDIVGRLSALLARLGLTRDTLVVFTSDNGPWFEGSAGRLRARKGGAAYDGGYRVPFIASRPGTVRAGQRTPAIGMGVDLLPTFCAMAGRPPPAGVEIDGRDLTATLTHGAPSPHDELLLFNDEDVVAVRTQRWKYVAADHYRGTVLDIRDDGYPQLYDMAHDPGETYSLAARQPQALHEMTARLARARARFEPLRKGPSGIVSRPGPRAVPEVFRD
ncbi:MAG: sulfatase-like hydrolase/transferase [Phenylobacterium sp.]|uniref:sulfatase-like hydrolase/transferase n=1 Tax=Phenylobacterium sp. TaxID=1871053 RepID=UPI001A612057|nr:sulfatase-like hydrolase/transferase [Phenylobacterium sp.]MBL8554388.1 sulfatase-like hydrolase/transferase [Phenylobacterium sp.]